LATNRPLWLWLWLLLALTGCKTIRSVREPLSISHRLPSESELRALASTAEYATELSARRAAAKRAIVQARQMREASPDRVEGHYWYAIAAGLLADADRSYGLDAVGEMETALKRAIEIDERYDLAGPLRVLGLLHLRAPPPPVSMGSPRKGLRLLQRAVELFPEYPENYLYLAEALRDTGKLHEARAAAQKVLDAPPWTGRSADSERWKAQAKKLLQSETSSAIQ